MSCCISCNGKGRICDFCGFDLPEEYVQDGDNDYCNNDVPEGQKNCWQLRLGRPISRRWFSQSKTEGPICPLASAKGDEK